MDMRTYKVTNIQGIESSDCDEVLRGVENYEVLNIKPHGYELHVLLDRPKEAKK